MNLVKRASVARLPLFRILDEINEDIVFLSAARTSDTVTPMHERFLRAFYEPHLEGDPDSTQAVKNPDTPTRPKIRQYMKRVLGDGIAESNADALIAQAYGGYVHAMSQNVMEMYGGYPPRFQIRGMIGSPLMESHSADAMNYLFRAFLSFSMAAKAFGDRDLLKAMEPHLDEFHRLMEMPQRPNRA